MVHDDDDDLSKLAKMPLDKVQMRLEAIKSDENTKQALLDACSAVFEGFRDGQDREMVRRCLDVWFLLEGYDHPLAANVLVNDNLIVESVDVVDYVDIDQDRTDGNENENDNDNDTPGSLSNLVIEEVEITDYVETQ